jgi:hypothetical protein
MSIVYYNIDVPTCKCLPFFERVMNTMTQQVTNTQIFIDSSFVTGTTASSPYTLAPVFQRNGIDSYLRVSGASPSIDSSTAGYFSTMRMFAGIPNSSTSGNPVTNTYNIPVFEMRGGHSGATAPQIVASPGRQGFYLFFASQVAGNTEPGALTSFVDYNPSTVNYQPVITGNSVPVIAIGHAPSSGFTINTVDIPAPGNKTINLIATRSFINMQTDGPAGVQMRSANAAPSASSGLLTLSVPGAPGSTRYFTSFITGGTPVGSISSPTGSTTAYNTSSDYRLKKNVTPIENGLDIIGALRPRSWEWKNGNEPGIGFIAHELQEDLPNAPALGIVNGKKDGVLKRGKLRYTAGEFEGQFKVERWLEEEDGVEVEKTADVIVEEPDQDKVEEYRHQDLLWVEDVELVQPEYQGVDSSFLIAPLVSAVKQLSDFANTMEERMSQLESRISSLEANA